MYLSTYLSTYLSSDPLSVRPERYCECFHVLYRAAFTLYPFAYRVRLLLFLLLSPYGKLREGRFAYRFQKEGANKVTKGNARAEKLILRGVTPPTAYPPR